MCGACAKGQFNKKSSKYSKLLYEFCFTFQRVRLFYLNGKILLPLFLALAIGWSTKGKIDQILNSLLDF